MPVLSDLFIGKLVFADAAERADPVFGDFFPRRAGGYAVVGVAEQLKVAISYGDLSENAEYDAAKNDQAVLEQRIAELKAMIENAVVVDESKISTDTVGFGSRVTIVYEDDPDEEETYTIVGTSESDPTNGKLSNESPVGAALVGAHVGETVVAQTPGGALRIKVIEIAL